MIHQEITMTIKQNISIAYDLGVDNDVMHIDQSVLDCKLAGASVVFSDSSIFSSQEKALKLIVDLIKKNLPTFEPWVFVGHTTWQPDTRITRYQKFWKGLDIQRERGTLSGEPLDEYLIESTKGIKFFSALKYRNLDFREIIKFIQDEPACTFAYIKSGGKINIFEELLRTGWEKNYPFPPIKLLNAVCLLDALIFSPLGQFDDRESGFAVFGRKEYIEKCFSEQK